MHKHKIVFTMGPPHSGTTWLCLVLGAHPDAMAVGELYRLNKKFKRMSAHKAGVKMPCAVCGGSCRLWRKVKSMETISAQYSYLFNVSQKSFLVDSSKKTAYIDAVTKEAGYDVKIIFITRKAEDAIYHYYARNLATEKKIIGWFKGRNEKLEWLKGKDHLVINYEDAFGLVALKKMGDYLGMKTNPEMFEYWRQPIHSIIGARSAMAPVNAYHKLTEVPVGNNGEFLETFNFEVKPVSFGERLPSDLKQIIKEYEH